MWPNPQETADLVKFTEEILNGKLHFLCSAGTLISMKNEKENPNNAKTNAHAFA